MTRLLLLLPFLPSLALAQSLPTESAASPPQLPPTPIRGNPPSPLPDRPAAVTSQVAVPPAQTTAIPSTGTEAQTAVPMSPEELQRKLAATTEALARHDAELRDLRAALAASTNKPSPPPGTSENWYERLSIRGYLQVRYNQIPSGVNNENLINDQGDKSIGGTGGIYIRRARLIVSGDVHPQVSVYIQPDFASAINDQLNVGIVRDYYADIFLDRKREFRFRVGQSKVPFGFENMQSSQNRVALDRTDGINSAVPNERELGLFFYWAPAHIRSRFKYLVDSGLKGSGDFGVIGLGVYNGQIINRAETNKTPHAVLRVTWPFEIRNQILELGTGGYYGLYTVKLETAKDGTKYTSTADDNNITEARGHVSAVLYPKPIGVAFEYNAGVGPSLGVDAEKTVVASRFLHGGYLQLMARFERVAKTVALTPYVRASLYEGGKKQYANAPHYSIRELEFGLEWQILRALEIVGAYMIADRTSDKYPYNQEYGHVTRLQVQVNY